MKRSVWSTLFVWLLAVAFLASLWGLWKGLTAPNSKIETTTLLTYEFQSEFSHRAFGLPAADTSLPNEKYFAQLVDSIEMSYTYEFRPSAPVGQVTSRIEVVALVDTGLWQKDFPLTDSTTITGKDAKVIFSLDTSHVEELVKEISEEIGIPASSPDFTLQAQVHTEVNSSEGEFELDFVHPLDFREDRQFVEWGRNLARRKRGYQQGIEYEVEGIFGYQVKYKSNPISPDETVFRSTVIPPVMPSALPLAAFYPQDEVERVDVTLEFSGTSDPPLRRENREVSVTAVLETADGQRTFVLVPRSREEGDFSLTFPLDTILYYAVVDAADQENDGDSSSRLLTINSKVRVIGESDAGPVDETLAHSQMLQLAPGRIHWDEGEPATLSDSITSSQTIPNPNATNIRVIAISGAVFMAFAFGYVFWNYLQAGRIRAGVLELEALNARQKHGEFLVDVGTAPRVTDDTIVVRLGSVEELFKAAEALMKPVLHYSEPDQHTYYVLDGSILYQYLNREGSRDGPSSQALLFWGDRARPPPR